MVLELCEMGTLQDYLYEKKDERLSEREARNLFRQVVSVFAKMHNLGYIHRDIKLDNLFLKKENNKLVIKVGDFG